MLLTWPNPWWCSVTLKVEEFFLIFKQIFLYFSLCPLPLVHLLDSTEKGLALSSVFPISDAYILRLLYSKLKSSSSLICQMFQVPLPCLCGPWLDWFKYVHLSVVLEIPELGTALQRGLTKAERRERITSPRKLSFIISSYTNWSWKEFIESGDLPDGRVRPKIYNNTWRVMLGQSRDRLSLLQSWGKGRKKWGSSPWNRLRFQAPRNSRAFWSSSFIQIIDELVWPDLNPSMFFASSSLCFIFWQRTRENNLFWLFYPHCLIILLTFQ